LGDEEEKRKGEWAGNHSRSPPPPTSTRTNGWGKKVRNEGVKKGGEKKGKKGRHTILSVFFHERGKSPKGRSEKEEEGEGKKDSDSRSTPFYGEPGCMERKKCPNGEKEGKKKERGGGGQT